MPVDAPADLTTAIERETTITSLGAAFSRLPAAKRNRVSHPVTGNSLIDIYTNRPRDSPLPSFEFRLSGYEVDR